MSVTNIDQVQFCHAPYSYDVDDDDCDYNEDNDFDSIHTGPPIYIDIILIEILHIPTSFESDKFSLIQQI